MVTGAVIATAKPSVKIYVKQKLGFADRAAVSNWLRRDISAYALALLSPVPVPT